MRKSQGANRAVVAGQSSAQRFMVVQIPQDDVAGSALSVGKLGATAGGERLAVRAEREAESTPLVFPLVS